MTGKRAGKKRTFARAGNETVNRRVVADADYLADLEQSDGQMRKRMKRRERGKAISPPREPR